MFLLLFLFHKTYIQNDIIQSIKNKILEEKFIYTKMQHFMQLYKLHKFKFYAAIYAFIQILLKRNDIKKQK